MQPWNQNYDPFSNAWLSTIAAAVPVILLFYLLAVRKILAYRAALYSSAVCILIALFVFHMPWRMAAGAVSAGLVYGAIRIGWVLLAAVFVYELTVESGHFEVIKQLIGGVTSDRRLQTLLIGLAFSAVLEGAGGGGAPVAITAAMMVGLGFEPFAAAVLCLVANTAPVAFGGVGNPIRALIAVTGIPGMEISGMIGRILPWLAFILPFWLIRIMCSWAEMWEVWPGLLLCGSVFAGIQFYWSNFVDYGLVDIVGGMATLLALVFFLKVWKPAKIWRFPQEPEPTIALRQHSAKEVIHAWSPFLILSALVILWGLPAINHVLEKTTFAIPVPGLDKQVFRMPPVVPQARAESAVYDLAWLSGVGTATFFAGLIAGPILGLSFGRTLQVFFRTCHRMRFSMIAIMGMLTLGFVTRYCGMDAVMGLAMTHTGVLFPFFGTMLGWLGVALTGTDAGSNALFGSLQVITANKLGLNPTLMAAANSAGGVMGKMISPQ
ncbi:MAG: lactate permease LctP family transporter, partial [Acidobacteriota bacterium]|nr:lactate permease LctP family transporter [Acidobacteriota bacterium]